MQEEPSRPMIIVVRGKPSSRPGRSKVATQLANYLRYPLFDQDDLAPALQDSLPSSSLQPPQSASQNNLSDSSFKILQQIASAQLRTSKLGVIINSPLTNHFHLDQLKQLANSQGAELMLIQCQPPDEIDDYDVGQRGRKITVDTNEFHMEEFVSEHLLRVRPLPRSVALQPNIGKLNIPKGNLVKTPSLRTAKRVTERIPLRHLHALTYKPKNNEGGALHCKCCQNEISGPFYQCLDCDEYIFDKACAESPDLDQVRQNCPDYLKAREPKEYRFSEICKCNICEEKKLSFLDCHDCLFQTNMKSKFLPIVVNHESHAHPLNLIIMPPSLNYEFGCCGCGEFGKSISYRCYDCNFNLHVGCVSLPRTASSKHDKHTLRLTYDALDHNYWDKSYCVVCKKERNPEQWFYFCPICDTVTHIGCARATD
ncbi:uncharacterized protein LOC111277910 [Durio zibethinus]|uniref:Uncharacterized protein LOC111277910 n=1 Tax=Durio zibethinus TaxID=66656 RepID=A0A6P5WVA9_DURZI|nr:uncharacterized protein LOC111277910 [Durio zibethinus]